MGTFKIVACGSVNRYGLGIVVVDGPMVSGNTYTIRCHSLFSQKGDSYRHSDVTYDSDVLAAIGEDQLLDEARDSGAQRLTEMLEADNSLHYRFMLEHGGLKFDEQDESFMKQLHMRLRIDTSLEVAMKQNALSPDFRKWITTIVEGPRLHRGPWV